jgi:hypothetical protein
MVHYRYIKKGGKKYGPYFYESYRENGQIKKHYLGQEPPKNSRVALRVFTIAFIILAIIFAAFIFYSFLKPNFLRSVTGRVSLDIERNYVYGEQLSGRAGFSLKGGEFIPADTLIRVSLGDQVKEVRFSDLNLTLSEGQFYAEGGDLSGSGQGFGVLGEKKFYPTLDFEMLVSTALEVEQTNETITSSNESVNPEINQNESTSSNESVISGGSSGSTTTPETTTPETTTPETTNPETTTPTTPETTTPETTTPTTPEITTPETTTPETTTPETTTPETTTPETTTPETTTPETTTPETTTPQASSSSSSSESSSSSSSESSSSSSSESSSSSSDSGSAGITGNVVDENSYVYPATVSKDLEFSYTLEEGQTANVIRGTVKSNGSVLQDNLVKLNVNGRNVIATTDYYTSEQGYGEEYLIDNGTSFSLDLSSLGLNATSSKIKFELIYNNETYASLSKGINVIGLNESLNDTLVNLTLLGDIPSIKMGVNGSYIINLEDYFVGAQRYEFVSINLSASFDENIINISADPDFRGSRNGQIIAYSENENVTSNQFSVLVYRGNIGISTSRSNITINEPVKWIKNVSLETTDSVSIEIPKLAENVTVTAIDSNDAEFVPVSAPMTGNAITGFVTASIDSDNQPQLAKKLKNLFGITARVIEEINPLDETIAEPSTVESIDITLEDNATEYTIEYVTPAPISTEEDNSLGKEVVISGPSELNYEDILTYTNIPEIYNVGEEGKIKIYWVENETYIPFDAYDMDGNGKLDYLEWITPHLSTQTFQIILITRAVHLDSNKTFIEDIYDNVKDQDNVYAVIPQNHYVRVTFEKNLTSYNDIKLFAYSNDGARIEVYEANSDVLLASYPSITGAQYYQVLMTNLNNSQDQFDLHILNGNISIDHIIDPSLSINYVFPNPANDTITSSGNVILNFSISSGNDALENITYNWNGTNYSMYDPTLKLMMNFDDYTGYIDTSKYGNNGSDIGGESFSASGKYGRSYNFYGGNYIETPITDLSGSQLTVAFWFKGSNSGSAFRQQADAGATYLVFPWGSNLHIMSNDGGVSGINVDNNGGNTVNDGNWHHILVTWKQNTANGFASYLDGELIASRTSSNTPIPNIASTVEFGRYKGNTEFTNGDIDEMRIWSRFMTADEVKQHYMSSLQKLNSTQWLLSVNQSKTPTTVLDLGRYTYFASLTDAGGSSTQTSPRTLTRFVNTNRSGIKMIYPSNSIVASQNSFFNVSVNVSCLEGNCGTINTTLYYAVPLTSGSNWTVPAGVNSIFVTVVGAGGGGGAGYNSVAGAGGGGGGSASSPLTVSPGSMMNYSIGEGGARGYDINIPGSSGGQSWFGGNSFITSSVSAGGGGGGSAGTEALANVAGSSIGGEGGIAVGVVAYNGGNGGDGSGWTDGAGGGGAAGITGSGSIGGNSPTGTGGSGQYPGGKGGTGSEGPGGVGTNGSIFGGGGAGARGGTGYIGNAGAKGGIIVYIPVSTSSSATPFYTNVSNPTTTSSLNMGQSEIVTFYVNATGTMGYMTNLVAFSNIVSNNYYPGMNITVTGNITIQDLVPPVVDLIDPLNSSIVINEMVRFNSSQSDGSQLKNSTLYVWNSTGLFNSTSLNLSGSLNTSSILVNLTTNGVYKWNYYVCDTSDNCAFNNTNWTVTYTTDITAPSLSIVYPANTTYNSVITALNYSAIDSVGLSTCWYSTNSGTTNTTISCGTNVTGLTASQGTNTWTVWANDTSNNVNVSRVTFFVDTISPVVDLIAPINASTTTTAVNWFSANFTDSGIGLSTATLYVWNSTSFIGTNFTIISGSTNSSNLSLNLPRVGNYSWNYLVNDSLGNNAWNSTNWTLTYIALDTTKPLIQFVSPTPNSGTVQSLTTLNINVTASDESTLSNITIFLYNSTMNIIRQNISTISPFNISYTSLSDGIYYFNASAYDSTSNFNSTELRNVTIDTTAPALSIAYPANTTYNSVINALNYSANDSVGLSTCWYSTNSGTTNTTIACGTNVTGLTASQGTNTWTVWANDTSNNVNVSRVTFFVDSISPVVDLIAPINASTSLNDINYFSANITDSGIGLSSATLYVWNSTSLIGTNFTTISGSTNSSNLSITLPRFGNYTWNYLVNDSLGNNAWNSTNWTLSYISAADTTLPVVNLNAPLNGTNTTSAINYFSSNFSDNSGLSNATLYVWNSSSLIGTNITNISGVSNSTNLSITLPRSGNYTWNYLVYDNSSNSAFNSTNWTVEYIIPVDTTLPQVQIVYPQNTSYLPEVTSLNYSASDDTGLFNCWYSIDSGTTNTTITCGNNVTGLVSYNDSNTWTVWVNDTSGNINSSSITFSVVPLVLTNIGEQVISGSSARINFNANWPVNGTFKYGTTESLSSVEYNVSYSNSQTILLTGLTPNSVYYYNVTGCTSSGTCSTQGPFSFLTIAGINITSNKTASNSAFGLEGSPAPDSTKITINVSVNALPSLSDAPGMFINLTGLDVMLIIDDTYGMNESLSGLTDFERSISSAQYFVGKLTANDNVGVVSLGSPANLRHILSNDFVDVNNTLGNMIISPSQSAIGDSLRYSIDELISNGNPNHYKAIILMMSGADDLGNDSTNQAIRAFTNNITIYPIAQGENVDLDLANNMAALSRGSTEISPNGTTILNSYDSIYNYTSTFVNVPLLTSLYITDYVTPGFTPSNYSLHPTSISIDANNLTTLIWRFLYWKSGQGRLITFDIHTNTLLNKHRTNLYTQSNFNYTNNAGTASRPLALVEATISYPLVRFLSSPLAKPFRTAAVNFQICNNYSSSANYSLSASSACGNFVVNSVTPSSTGILLPHDIRSTTLDSSKCINATVNVTVPISGSCLITLFANETNNLNSGSMTGLAHTGMNLNLLWPRSRYTHISSNPIPFNFTMSYDGTLSYCTVFARNSSGYEFSQLNTTQMRVYRSNIINMTLPDGVYNWTVRCMDDTLPYLFNATQNWIVYVVADKPVVTLISPINNTSTTNSTIYFAANFTSPYGIKNATLYVWNSTGIVNTSFVGLSGNYNSSNISYSLPRNGTYTWNYIAYNNLSNFAWHSSNWTINYTYPILTITEPNVTCTANNCSVNFTSNEFPINVTFNLYNNATLSLVDSQGPTVIASNSQLPINYSIPQNLNDGIYKLNMTVQDSYGNSVTQFLEYITVSVSPVVNLNSPVNGTTTARALNYFSANMSDNTALKNATLYVWNSTNLIETNFTQISGINNFTNLSITLPQYGNYTWNYFVHDNFTASAWNSTNWTINYIQQNLVVTEPNVTCTANNCSVNFTSNEFPINVTFNLYNNVTLSLVDSQGPTVIASNSQLPTNYDIPQNLNDGIYKLNMTVQDSYGNSVTQFLEYIIVSISPIVQLSNNATHSNNDTFYMVGSFTDNTALKNATLYVWNSTGDVIYSEFVSITGSSNSSNISLQVNNEGIYTWNYFVHDNFTASAWATANYTFVYDTTVPIATIVSPAAVRYGTNSYAIQINLNEAGVCEYSVDGGARTSLTADGSLTIFTGTESNVQNGVYTLNAYCADLAGNRDDSQQVTFTIDTNDPSCHSFTCGDWSCNGLNFTRVCDDSCSPPLPSYIETGPECSNVCTPNWILGSWGSCDPFTGNRTASYYDSNSCGDDSSKPADEQQVCSAVCDQQCSSWGTCSYGSRIEDYFKLNVTLTGVQDRICPIDLTCQSQRSCSITYPITIGSVCNDVYYQITNETDGIIAYILKSDYDNGILNLVFPLNGVNDLCPGLNPLVEFVQPTYANNAIYNRSYIITNVSANYTLFANITTYLYNSSMDLIDFAKGNESVLYHEFSGLVDGVYYINATALDIFGYSNNTETRVITLDSTSPTVTLSGPNDGANTEVSRVYLASIFTDNIMLRNATLYLWNSTDDLVFSTYIPITGLSSSANISVDLPSQGIYHWNYNAYDLAGNNAWAITNFSFVYSINFVDISAPVVNLEGSENLVTNIAEQYFAANISDDIRISNATLYIWNSTGDLVDQQLTILTGLNTIVNISFTLPYSGVFVWNYHAYDNSSNNAWNSTNWTINYNAQFVDTNPPIVDLLSVVNGTSVLNSFVTLSANITDDFSLSNATVYVWNSTGDLINNSVIILSGINFVVSINVPLYNYGNYTWNYNAYDLAGNNAWNSTNWTFSYDYSSGCSVTFLPGWNHISPGCVEGMNINLALADIQGQYDTILVWAPQSSNYIGWSSYSNDPLPNPDLENVSIFVHYIGAGQTVVYPGTLRGDFSVALDGQWFSSVWPYNRSEQISSPFYDANVDTVLLWNASVQRFVGWSRFNPLGNYLMTIPGNGLFLGKDSSLSQESLNFKLTSTINSLVGGLVQGNPVISNPDVLIDVIAGPVYLSPDTNTGGSITSIDTGSDTGTTTPPSTTDGTTTPSTDGTTTPSTDGTTTPSTDGTTTPSTDGTTTPSTDGTTTPSTDGTTTPSTDGTTTPPSTSPNNSVSGKLTKEERERQKQIKLENQKLIKAEKERQKQIKLENQKLIKAEKERQKQIKLENQKLIKAEKERQKQIKLENQKLIKALEMLKSKLVKIKTNNNKLVIAP